jgi:hypothetical protein
LDVIESHTIASVKLNVSNPLKLGKEIDEFDELAVEF